MAPPPPPAHGRPPSSATFDRIAGLFAPGPTPSSASTSSTGTGSGAYEPERPTGLDDGLAQERAQQAERERGRELALKVGRALDAKQAGNHPNPAGHPVSGRIYPGQDVNPSSASTAPSQRRRNQAQTAPWSQPSSANTGLPPASHGRPGPIDSLPPPASFARRSRSPQQTYGGQPSSSGAARRDRSPARASTQPYSTDPVSASSFSYPSRGGGGNYTVPPPSQPGYPYPHPSMVASLHSFPPVGAYGGQTPFPIASGSRSVFDAFGRPLPVSSPIWQGGPGPGPYSQDQRPPYPAHPPGQGPTPPSGPSSGPYWHHPGAESYSQAPPPPSSYQRQPQLPVADRFATPADFPSHSLDPSALQAPSQPQLYQRPSPGPSAPKTTAAVSAVPLAPVGGAAKRGSDRDEQPMPKRPKLDFQANPPRKKAAKAKQPVVIAPPEPLKPKPHRPPSAVPPPFDKELAPNLLLNYVVSLHRPHVRKRHPAALYDYAALEPKEDGAVYTAEDLVRCTITLPEESPIPDEFKVGRGMGTKPEGKQEAAAELVLNLWRCGELDDDYAPIVDADELERQTKASSCLGITPYRTKIPRLWTDCIASSELRLYPTLIVFPPVPVRPTPVAAISLPVPPPDVGPSEDGGSPTPPRPSTPPPIEYKTPRPLLMLTRLPLPSIKPGINLYFQDEKSTVTFTGFDAMALRQEDIDRVKTFSLTLMRAVVNRPMIYVDKPDGLPGEGPWYIAPVNMDWFDAFHKQQKEETSTPVVVAPEPEGKGKGKGKAGKKAKSSPKKRKQMEADPAAEREMVDWAEMDACKETTFEPWLFEDADELERQAKDAMVTGKAEFSRRMEVLRVRRDLNPHSSPADSPREAGSSSLLEYVKATTSTFVGLRSDDQALLEMRKIPGVLGHVRRADVLQLPTSLHKMHEQKYMIPELSQRSTLSASTFLSSLYLPSLTNRLEQVLLSKELNASLFKNTLDEHRLTEALTAPSTGGEHDYERLEYIGDSALKFLATIYLYVSRPQDNEHLLHDGRKIIIANGTLTQNAVDSGLPPYIHARDFSVKTWYPHNITVARPAIMPTEREIRFQDIGDKTKADVIESIIGAALEEGGIESAYRTCKLLKMRMPFIDSWAQMAKKVKIVENGSTFPATLRKSLGQVQDIIKYRFIDENLLCQALSPTSANHSNFQRLQFFGDAILDLLCVRYATTKFPSLGPGPLTHMKSAMINNHTTASLCVALDIYRFASFDGGVLPRAAVEYAPKITAAQAKEHETAKLEGRDPGQYWCEIDAPKILADVLEAIMAAILIDSGFKWNSVQAFFNDVQRPWMDQYIRGLGSLTGHPAKMLTEILQSRHCTKFDILKSITSTVRGGPGLAKTEITLHGHCLGWAVEVNANFSSRRASEFALTAIEGTPDLLERLCDCPATGGGGGGGGGAGKKVLKE